MNRWDPIFKMACQLEADIFNTGIQAPTPYLIVPQGAYSIQNFSIKEVVLADQKVESSGAGLSTVGLKKPSGTKEKVIEKWSLFIRFVVSSLSIVGCCFNQRRIYVPKRGERTLSGN